jgi:hypothetical protein
MMKQHRMTHSDVSRLLIRLIVTSVAYLSDDIITNDVMTRGTRLGLVYVYKGHWEDVYSPVPTLSSLLSTPYTVVGFPPHCPQSYPCRLKGLLLIWALLLLVRTCWTRFVLALSRPWTGLVESKTDWTRLAHVEHKVLLNLDRSGA